MVQLNGGGLVNENQRLMLVCQTDAYPSIDSYHWYRNHEKLDVNPSVSSLIIEKVTKNDTGTYLCRVKNTLKYSNGSSLEKSNQTQTKVMVQCKRFLIRFFLRISISSLDAPRVTTDLSIIAIDVFEKEYWTLLLYWFVSRIDDCLEISWSDSSSIQ